MTRINVIPVQELSDQHLIAEYHELPRVIKQKIDISDAPDKYCLGKGHMKWARKHLAYTLVRFAEVRAEMWHRGFTAKYGARELSELVVNESPWKNYIVTGDDIILNRERIAKKYRLKPNWYHWTNREKPRWLA